ncbi:hypothetical protein EDC96DRAFT_92811 [Choanephora cucurbitarum]|nr:hypothetical protein EDC96DRAFT_92811 [Choanephora cucurbitarum]
MPSVALSTAEDKNKVRRALPTAKIYAATVARLYVAYPNPNKWAYANIWGAIAFLKDKKKHSYYIRIIDLINHKGVIWEQELYDGFEITRHTPFFFSFAADEYMAGLSFADNEDADVFYNKIATREITKTKHATKSKKKESSNKKQKGKLDKSQIGLPSEFRHLGHIGYTPDKGFSVQNSSPEWNGLFDQLKDLGISPEEIQQNEDFIKDFVNERGGPPPPPRRPTSTVAPGSPARTNRAPPPPPSRRQAPPPPPVGVRDQHPLLHLHHLRDLTLVLHHHLHLHQQLINQYIMTMKISMIIHILLAFLQLHLMLQDHLRLLYHLFLVDFTLKLLPHAQFLNLHLLWALQQ